MPRKPHRFDNFVTDHPVFKNVRPVFQTNFEGRVTNGNPQGRRTFCIRIDDSGVADQLHDQGWNVKTRYSRDDPNEVDFYYLEVEASYRNPTGDPSKDSRFKPTIVQVTQSGVATTLDESTVGLLDDMEIIKMNVKLRPYNWYDDKTKTEHVKAYLQKMKVLVEDDPFDDDSFGDEPTFVLSTDGTRVIDESAPATMSYEDDIPF